MKPISKFLVAVVATCAVISAGTIAANANRSVDYVASSSLSETSFTVALNPQPLPPGLDDGYDG